MMQWCVDLDLSPAVMHFWFESLSKLKLFQTKPSAVQNYFPVYFSVFLLLTNSIDSVSIERRWDNIYVKHCMYFCNLVLVSVCVHSQGKSL